MNLYEPHKLGNITLKNRIVMAPMTRARAIDNTPNELMARYYKQRASAGLIITEATAVSPNSLGYARMPGLFTPNQIEGWKKVTQEVGLKGGNMFAQIIHTGRVGHQDNMPEGGEVMAPSAITVQGEIHTDISGMQPYPEPRAMTKNDIEQAQREYVEAARNAIKAGFDGIELHGANGYLIEQFISPLTNQRNDTYGGSIENRCRFVIETLKQIVDAIGPDQVGVRLSPYGALNDMAGYDSIDETYIFLTKEIEKTKVAYIHLLDHSSLGAPMVPRELVQKIRDNYSGKIIFCGGLDSASAEVIVKEGLADLVAFGRAFVANPDLVYKMQHNLELNEVDPDTFYTPDDKGYVDYPTYQTPEPLNQN